MNAVTYETTIRNIIINIFLYNWDDANKFLMQFLKIASEWEAVGRKSHQFLALMQFISSEISPESHIISIFRSLV